MHLNVLPAINGALVFEIHSHARNGNEIQTSGRRGSAEKIEKLGFLIPVNPKHA